jgi:WD40 repeat protein
VKVWDAGTGQETLTLKGHTSGVKSGAYSPDGMRLASASYDQTVKVWDAGTGREPSPSRGTPAVS